MSEEMMDWQTIETAPKDGSEVLLYFAHYGTRRIGMWGKYRDASYPFVWQDQYGDALVRPWKDDPGPTHWMPLPAPPTAETAI